jgi:hypothetical protein
VEKLIGSLPVLAIAGYRSASILNHISENKYTQYPGCGFKDVRWVTEGGLFGKVYT